MLHDRLLHPHRLPLTTPISKMRSVFFRSGNERTVPEREVLRLPIGRELLAARPRPDSAAEKPLYSPRKTSTPPQPMRARPSGGFRRYVNLPHRSSGLLTRSFHSNTDGILIVAKASAIVITRNDERNSPSRLPCVLWRGGRGRPRPRDDTVETRASIVTALWAESRWDRGTKDTACVFRRRCDQRRTLD